MLNHQIVDNNIMVQEDIHSSRENKDKGMVIKIDMVNAFDRVRNYFSLMSYLNLDYVPILSYVNHHSLTLVGSPPW
jgi:hypothetical protein